jgi:hypothetical protein
VSFFHPRQVQVVTESGIKITDLKEDCPKFAREYTRRLDDGRSIKVTLKSYSWTSERSASGELDQSNGRYVLFDPRAIADKILDPVLVPLVQAACDEIEALDRAYMASNRPSFVDERGTKWVRE